MSAAMQNRITGRKAQERKILVHWTLKGDSCYSVQTNNFIHSLSVTKITHVNQTRFKKEIKDGSMTSAYVLVFTLHTRCRKLTVNSLNLSRKYRLLKLNSILESSLAMYNSAFQMTLREQLHKSDSWYAQWSAWLCLMFVVKIKRDSQSISNINVSI